MVKYRTRIDALGFLVAIIASGFVSLLVTVNLAKLAVHLV